MKKNQWWFISTSVLISLCIVCGVAVLAINYTGNPIPTATMVTENDVQIIIANTYNAAQTQTAIVAPPTSTPFVYESPTLLTQSTVAPTWTPIPTETLFILTLATVPVNDQTAQCICTTDTYNCGDSLAEACFNYCNTQGYGDIHRLDQNNNGVACEDY